MAYRRRQGPDQDLSRLRQELDAGLTVAPGERVVINGQHYLADGEAVNVVDALAIEEITSLEAD